MLTFTSCFILPYFDKYKQDQKHPSSPTGDGGSPGHGRLFGQRGGLHGQRVPTNRFPLCVAVQRRRSGALASSGFRPRAGAVSHRRTAGRDQTACVDHHSRRTGLGRRFGVEHQTPAILCRKALRCLHFPRSVAKTPAPQRAVVETADLHIGERRSGSTKEF